MGYGDKASGEEADDMLEGAGDTSRCWDIDKRFFFRSRFFFVFECP